MTKPANSERDELLRRLAVLVSPAFAAGSADADTETLRHAVQSAEAELARYEAFEASLG